MMKKRVIAGVLIAALVGTGGWYMMQRKSSQAASGAPRYIEEPVRRGTIRSQISGSGAVKATNGVTVKAGQTGTLAQILVKEGDKVQAGQAVMLLENKTLLSSLSQAKLDLENAQANLENLLNPQETAVRSQELKVENARLTLQQRQDDVVNLTVRAPLTGVIASVGVVEGGSINNNGLLFTIYDEATPTLILQLPQETASQLGEGQRAFVTIPGHGTYEGAVARRGGTASPVSGNRDANIPVAIDLPAIAGVRPGMVGQVTIQAPGLTYKVQGQGAIENDAKEVRAKVAGTAKALAVSEGQAVTAGDLLLTIENDSLLVQLQQAENDLKSQEQSLTNLLQPHQDPSRQLASLSQKLQQSQLNHSQKQADVDELTVKAPVAGTISAIALSVGDKVAANANLFRVADYGAMQVTIAVDELDVAQVKIGQPADITLDAIPGKSYHGTVIQVNPEGTVKNDIATFEVTIAIERSEGLMAGMNALVSVTVAERKDVLSVPVAAVRVQRGQATVSVLENGQPVTREIQVGVKTSDRYEVLSGLNEGDKVITTTIRAQSGVGGLMGGSNPFGGNRAPATGQTPVQTPTQTQPQRRN